MTLFRTFVKTLIAQCLSLYFVASHASAMNASLGHIRPFAEACAETCSRILDHGLNSISHSSRNAWIIRAPPTMSRTSVVVVYRGGIVCPRPGNLTCATDNSQVFFSAPDVTGNQCQRWASLICRPGLSGIVCGAAYATLIGGAHHLGHAELVSDG